MIEVDRLKFEKYYHKIDDEDWSAIVSKIFWNQRLGDDEITRLLEFLFDPRSKIVEGD